MIQKRRQRTCKSPQDVTHNAREICKMGNNPSYFLKLSREYCVTKEEIAQLKSLCIEFTRKGMVDSIIKDKLIEVLQDIRNVPSRGSSGNSNSSLPEIAAASRTAQKVDEDRRPQITKQGPLLPSVMEDDPVTFVHVDQAIIVPMRPTTPTHGDGPKTKPRTGNPSPRIRAHTVQEPTTVHNDHDGTAAAESGSNRANFAENTAEAFLDAVKLNLARSLRVKIAAIEGRTNLYFQFFLSVRRVIRQLMKQRFVMQLLEINTHEITKSSTYTRSKLIHNGKTFFARTKEHVDVHIYFHFIVDGAPPESDAFPIVEVIGYKSAESEEFPRLYIAYNAMKDILQSQLDLEKEQEDKKFNEQQEAVLAPMRKRSVVPTDFETELANIRASFMSPPDGAAISGRVRRGSISALQSNSRGMLSADAEMKKRRASIGLAHALSSLAEAVTSSLTSRNFQPLLSNAEKEPLLIDFRKGVVEYIFKKLNVVPIPKQAVWPLRRLTLQFSPEMLEFAALKLGTVPEPSVVSTSSNPRLSGDDVGAVPQAATAAVAVVLDPDVALKPLFVSDAQFLTHFRPAVVITRPKSISP